MIGDTSDVIARLQKFLPSRWFPSDAGTRIYAMISGFAAVLAANYAQIVYAGQQSSISTATDAFLDIGAADWLGDFPRRLNESDGDYRTRIKAEIIRQRNTREAIYRVLLDLTGNIATIFRPSYVFDTRAYGYSAYGSAGAWGSYQAPFQALVQIDRGTTPSTRTLSEAGAGWGSPNSGYGVGSAEWADGSQQALGAVTDADIYGVVASVTPAGHINWVAISG